jgi:hypothetical protein
LAAGAVSLAITPGTYGAPGLLGVLLIVVVVAVFLGRRRF